MKSSFTLKTKRSPIKKQSIQPVRTRENEIVTSFFKQYDHILEQETPHYSSYAQYGYYPMAHLGKRLSENFY